MWRYLAGGVVALLLVAAGLVWVNGRDRAVALLPTQPVANQGGNAEQAAPLPASVPEASEKTREQKRFDRYDKDRDGKVTRDEYLMQRRKAFAKLDTNHDGQLSFDEWAIKAETKFATADADRSGALTATEFATTKVQRKTHLRKPCVTMAPAGGQSDDGKGDEG